MLGPFIGASGARKILENGRRAPKVSMSGGQFGLLWGRGLQRRGDCTFAHGATVMQEEKRDFHVSSSDFYWQRQGASLSHYERIFASW